MHLSDIHSPADVHSLSVEELNGLCPEIRELIIRTVSQNGGHLGSNLGVVELTLALHKVFELPKDRILFDVGHQSYTHKILTGRRDTFSTLRKKDGISGFMNREESAYDPYTAGHSSNAISVALGYARANKALGIDGSVVAVVGDGALTGGLSYEGLNDAGNSKLPIVIVLNDNEMSISPNVGAISRHLTHLRTDRHYFRFKKNVERMLLSKPHRGENLYQALYRIKSGFKHLFVDGELFEQLGFIYIGPIDGHDIEELVYTLERAKEMNCPVVVHVQTQKGRGYEPAIQNPAEFHGISPFDIETGKPVSVPVPSNGSYAVDTLLQMAGEDPAIVAVSAATQVGTDFYRFAEKYPDRFYDVGIAEEHALSMSAGLALGGLRPYIGIYSTFLQRAYDQILEDIALQKVPVTLLIDRGGLTGEDGVTHQGIFDLSYLSTCPDLDILCPGSPSELVRMIEWSRQQDCPVAIRYPKTFTDPYGDDVPVRRGKSVLLRKGTQLVLIGAGDMAGTCLKAAELLAEDGISCMVVGARFIKPLDATLLKAVASMPLMTVEDNVRSGGFGEQVAAFYADGGFLPKMKIHALPDAFQAHASRQEQLHACRMDAEGIRRTALEFLRKDGR
ncbi:MAG: 1-deoxy-D-xylulose-5-phosphate synthase [Clostridia bacterium]|nr:1-deoxy-D-xylulose-5-phosphate synthase [Clostridia bacterium]